MAEIQINLEPRGIIKRGDVLEVRISGYQNWGRMQDKRQWIAAGRDPADWHGNTAIISLQGFEIT